MTIEELSNALRQLRLSGIVDTLTIRAQQARVESLGPADFLALLVHDELERRRDRLVERRVKEATFRDRKSLDTFDYAMSHCPFPQETPNVWSVGGNDQSQ